MLNRNQLIVILFFGILITGVLEVLNTFQRADLEHRMNNIKSEIRYLDVELKLLEDRVEILEGNNESN